MQVIPQSQNQFSISSTPPAPPQSNMTGEQQFNTANVMLNKQRLVVGEPLTVPSALTLVYSKLHKYAFEGKKTKLKKLIKDNKDWINVDVYDVDGYTALYLASLNKHKNCVRVLLEDAGAKPNEPCRNGETSLHAAAMSGSVSTLRLLMEYGGNINLEDADGRSAKHYAMFKNPNANTRRKMLFFIEEINFNNLTSTNTSANNPSQHRRHRSHCSHTSPPVSNINSVIPITNKKPTITATSIPPPPPPMTLPILSTQTTTPVSSIKPTAILNSANINNNNNNNISNNSLNDNLEIGGVGVTVMLQCINENSLLHDITGITINNGSFMVYEAMKLRENHLVSIKRLHSKVAEGGSVSLLINELNAFRHRINNFPKILTLMGFCQTSTNGENGMTMVLMFERIALGSLFHILHEIKLARKPKLKSVTSIMLNVCDALVYLHEKSLIHCYVNSHSVFLTHHHIAKLGNLEYSFDKLSTDSKKQLDKRPKVSENRYKNCAWNWMAPELMQFSNSNNNTEQVPNESSDMYGFCVVIWELFNTSIPWDGLKWSDIYHKVVEEHETLHVDFNLIPLPFSRIIKDGLNLNSLQRMRFDEVKALLESCQQSLNEVHKQHTAQKRLIRNNTSFSEGIVDIKAMVANENAMSATMNSSIEELDKFSQFSSNDNVNGKGNNGGFIYCDAYKTEVHLTNKKNIRSRSLNPQPRSTSDNKPIVLKQQTNNNHNINKNGKQKSHRQSFSTHHHKQQRANHDHIYKNQYVESTESKRDSDDDNKRSNRRKSTVPPPPPPPPPPMQDKISIKNNPNENISSSNLSKLKQHSKEDPLPPTPPPSISQLQKKFTISNTNKTPSPMSTNKCNLPLPPSLTNTNASPSQFHNTTSSRSAQNTFFSKSVDSPRTPLNQTTLNNYINNNKNTSISKNLKKVCSDSNDNDYDEVNIDNVLREKEEKEARSNSIIRKSELFDKIVARLERKNSSLNDINRYASSSNKNEENANSEYMDELDTSLSLLKRDKFKLLENLYRLDASVISPREKEKLFNLIQQRQQQRTQHLLQHHQQQLLQQDNNTANIKDLKNETEKKLDKEEEERRNLFNLNFQKFDQFQNNLQRPTPDDKKRFYLHTNKSMQLNTPINKNKNMYTITPLNHNKLDSNFNNLSNVGGSMLINSGESLIKTAIANTSTAIQTPPTNKKLDLSTISQEDNTRHALPPSPHYSHLNQESHQRNARRTSPISSTTSPMPRSQSLTNTNNQQQRLLNSETAEAIAVSTKNGLLSSIKALSRESLNSSTHLMDTQEFYHLASKITNNSSNIANEEIMQKTFEHQDDSTKHQTSSKSTKKEKKPLSSCNLDHEKEVIKTNIIQSQTSIRTKSNSLCIENISSTNLPPPHPPSHIHNHHLQSPSASGSVPLNNLKQQRSNHNLDILNGGSVKSLVQSYEEFPHKEVNSVDTKIIQMREERQKELESVVEQSRLALNSELMVGSNPNDDEENLIQGLDEKRRVMQKELSTISERTEAPSPPDKNSIKNKITSLNNPSQLSTITVTNAIPKPMSNSSSNNITSSLSCSASALILNNSNKNTNNNVQATSSSVTSTKPIRNFNQNNLDMTINSNSQATILNQRFTFNDLNSTTGTNTTATLTNGTVTTIIPRHTQHKQQQGLVSTQVQTQTINGQNKIQNQNISYKNQPLNQSKSSDEDDEDDENDDEFSSSDEYEEEESNYCEHCDECDLKNGTKKAATIYSSQEDFINSLHSSAEECIEDEIFRNDIQNHAIRSKLKENEQKKNDSTSLMECSEAVYLNDFDKLASKYIYNTSKSIHNQHGLQVKENGSPAILLNQHPPMSLPQSHHDKHDFQFPLASQPMTSQNRQKSNDNCGTVTASIGLGPNQMITNTYPRPNNGNTNSKSPMYKNFSVEPKKSTSSTSSSLYSNASPATTNSSDIPPPPPPLPSDIFNKPHGLKLNDRNTNKNNQHQYSNVRLDKHIIDTSKFKGYSYKLETRSNVTNQYHIKSLLTNEQTGHQLLLANTKVKTPNMQTKVIIDQ